jgi:hypothetical protein
VAEETTSSTSTETGTSNATTGTENTNTNTTGNTETNTNTTGNVEQSTWREDWRQAMAKGDEKALNVYSRFTSPEALAEAYLQANKKISGGEFRVELPKDREATPQELQAWRKQEGVPDKPEDYYKALDPEIVIGEADKEAIDELMAEMHSLGAKPAHVKAAINTFYNAIERAQEEAAEAQVAIKKQAEDTLRKEWGGEYRANINAMANLLKGAPQPVQELLHGAVGPDGSMLFNNADFMRWFAGLTRELNPAITVLPNGSGDVRTGVTNKLAEYKKEMMSNINAWQAPANAAKRAEYLELLRAEEKLQSRR